MKLAKVDLIVSILTLETTFINHTYISIQAEIDLILFLKCISEQALIQIDSRSDSKISPHSNHSVNLTIFFLGILQIPFIDLVVNFRATMFHGLLFLDAVILSSSLPYFFYLFHASIGCLLFLSLHISGCASY